MTKVVKWWKRTSFWFKLKTYLLSIGIGTEAGLFFVELDGHGWKVAVGIATVLGLAITHIIEDKDGDGVADIFQNYPKNGKPKSPRNP